ncbi:asparaginase domain-containing protein [Arenibacter sp. M-2]|uniref:asparaginase domain-containing protein n=1 Tax=Arenibacter sp. M-2 TaxID=3053612 RepID=UPI0025706BA0|nr:asparaginase domain-containing protein [Arenibacter sp. M-2]MDL5514090.1 asparaginase domain-containing protein [Arenibacter sp. M-2]
MRTHIISTGGTIEVLDYENLNQKQTTTVAIDDILSNARVALKYTIEKILNKDSRFINDDDRELIAEKIKSNDSDKILLTHGTITMVETAQFLGRLALNKTIVLTGAFILGTKKNTDAPFNLGFALSALQILEPGVYIAMNGAIFNWDNVKKNNQNNRFETI